MNQVPSEFWAEACSVISLPVAAVGLDNRFIWVNHAFEELVGYTNSELRDMTWMEITEDAYVGGDMKSLEDLKRGNVHSYTMSKVYRHRFGKKIPVQLGVWRFPRAMNKVQQCFIVEAAPALVDYTEFIDKVAELEAEIDNLEQRINDPDINIRVGDDVGGDYAGRDKTTNHTVMSLISIFLSVIALILAILFIWTHMNH